MIYLTKKELSHLIFSHYWVCQSPVHFLHHQDPKSQESCQTFTKMSGARSLSNLRCSIRCTLEKSLRSLMFKHLRRSYRIIRKSYRKKVFQSLERPSLNTTSKLFLPSIRTYLSKSSVASSRSHLGRLNKSLLPWFQRIESMQFLTRRHV